MKKKVGIGVGVTAYVILSLTICFGAFDSKEDNAVADEAVETEHIETESQDTNRITGYLNSWITGWNMQLQTRKNCMWRQMICLCRKKINRIF